MAGRGAWVWRALLAVLVVAVLAAPAVGLWWVGAEAADRSAQGEPPATTVPPPVAVAGSPLLSVRRIPGVVTGQLTTASLLQGVAGVAAAVPETGCLLVTLDGMPLYDVRADVPVIPASNQKLVTAAVALEVLGPQHRLATVAATASPPSGGVVDGDLYLIGGGDPLLSTQPYLDWVARAGREVPRPHTSFEGLADAIVAAGITRITGSVVGDESRYDTQRRVATWPEGYRLSLEGGPLSALLVNDGFTSFAPIQSTTEPAQHAAAVLTELLAARGVAVGGSAQVGVAPAERVEIARIESVPMEDVVEELLTTSDNNTGELLLKELGLARLGEGSTAAGSQVVRETLATWGIADGTTVVADGSGLDRNNRATCRALVTVLQQGGEAVRAGLAVAGETGTLADAFLNNPARGRLRAKTGTLTGVKSLAGAIDVPEHDLAFALVLNVNNADAAARPLWERLGAALASYPDAINLDPFLPKPAPASAPVPAAPTTPAATTAPTTLPTTAASSAPGTSPPSLPPTGP